MLYQTAFALGSTLAFDKRQVLCLIQKQSMDLKILLILIQILQQKRLFDKIVQFVEFSGMGFAFNKIAPMFKAMKNIDVQKAATVVSGGSAAAQLEL